MFVWWQESRREFRGMKWPLSARRCQACGLRAQHDDLVCRGCRTFISPLWPPPGNIRAAHRHLKPIAQIVPTVEDPFRLAATVDDGDEEDDKDRWDRMKFERGILR
jgi:hypothetical protein